MARVVSDRGARRSHSVEGTDMLRVAQCEGKKRLSSPQIAWRVGRRKKGHAKAKPRDVYRCEYCGGWHLDRPN